MPGKARVLTNQEISSVLNSLTSLRDRCLFAVGVYTGLRISEIISLSYAQVYLPGGAVRPDLVIKRLKKRRVTYATIPVHPKLKHVLEQYKPVGGKWLFPSPAGGYITRLRAHQVLTRVFNKLGLYGARTHSMRRSCITHLSQNGVPIRVIQEISGHANLGQLQAYIDVSQEDIGNALRGLKYG